MTIRLANTGSGTSSGDLLRGAALSIAILAVACSASAQDQFRFGDPSVGRVSESRGSAPRDAGAGRGTDRASGRSASSIDAMANSRTISRPTTADRAPSFNRASSNASYQDRGSSASRNSGRSGNDRITWTGTGRSAIDPDGDGIGMRNPGSSRDRDNRGDWSSGNNWNSNDRDRRGSSWSGCSAGCGSSCSHVSHGYRGYRSSSGKTCGVNAYRCGGCSSCSGWSGVSVVYSRASYSRDWIDPWSTAYVTPVVVEPVVVEPVVVVQPSAAQPVYVVQRPVVVYATTDVSNAILAADAGAHPRAIALMRAYAGQHGTLPQYAELGPAARAALESVWRTYERAALTPGANADTYFMLGACRALRGDTEMAVAAFEAALAWGDSDPSTQRLLLWFRGS
ncbi:MAG: hypothetical protein KF902_00895 [Phycisphaeraceae bacterium]|nr:hypothetical protein [Phycisphaeraceae bacterium]MCW5767845.1 hypothetical protein [Phycisphaeraceae bacterium]